jgi:hypothetical protein
MSSIGMRLFHVTKAALVLRATQESHTCTTLFPGMYCTIESGMIIAKGSLVQP